MNQIIHGDCLQELYKLPDESVDLVCTDPPYGYSFMGKDWDKAVPSSDIWFECLRVLKPGGFAFVMSAPRSDVQAEMISRLQMGGFNLAFTPIYWTYASGFPKAMNIGKAVDKRNGQPRDVATHTGHSPVPGTTTNTCRKCGKSKGGSKGNCFCDKSGTPQTEQAKALDGSYGGFQPKPAVEVIIVAMKPLSEKTFVDQALKSLADHCGCYPRMKDGSGIVCSKHQGMGAKGVTWLDDCRIPASDNIPAVPQAKGGKGNIYGFKNGEGRSSEFYDNTQGRFPANLLVEDNVLGDHSRFFALPFLIVPKASKGEKNEGLEGRKKITVGDGRPVPIDNAFQRGKTERVNSHPTVKPLKLMSYLITLGSRPGDVVLDPFLGSGTTALAAKNLGRGYVGIEREKEYVEVAQARLATVQPTLLDAAE